MRLRREGRVALEVGHQREQPLPHRRRLTGLSSSSLHRLRLDAPQSWRASMDEIARHGFRGAPERSASSPRKVLEVISCSRVRTRPEIRLVVASGVGTVAQLLNCRIGNPRDARVPGVTPTKAIVHLLVSVEEARRRNNTDDVLVISSLFFPHVRDMVRHRSPRCSAGELWIASQASALLGTRDRSISLHLVLATSSPSRCTDRRLSGNLLWRPRSAGGDALYQAPRSRAC